MSDETITLPVNEVHEWDYEVRPKYMRFTVMMPDGENTLTLTQEQWEKLDREFHETISNARPIDDQMLQGILHELPGLRTSSWHGGLQQPETAVLLVNIARRADGLGYVLRMYEKKQDREWTLTTWGEWNALATSVRRGI